MSKSPEAESALAAALSVATEETDDTTRHAFKEPAHITADATQVRTPSDNCLECGWSRVSHPDYDPALFENPIRVNSGDANATEGTAKKRGKKSEATQAEMPGIPSGGIWGEYQGRRIAYVKLGFGGGPGAPRELAGHLDLGGEVWLYIGGTIAGNQHKRDKAGDTYEAVSIFVDTVSVDRIQPKEPEVPDTLMRKSLLTPLVARAWAALDPESDADVLALLTDLAHILDAPPETDD